MNSYPRPNRETHPHHDDKALEKMQAAWDHFAAVEKHQVQVSEIHRARREAKAAAVKAKQDAATQERQDAQRAELMRKLEGRYIQAGGTQDEFARDSAEIVRQHLIAEALDPNGAEAQSQAMSARQVLRGF